MAFFSTFPPSGNELEIHSPGVMVTRVRSDVTGLKMESETSMKNFSPQKQPIEKETGARLVTSHCKFSLRRGKESKDMCVRPSA